MKILREYEMERAYYALIEFDETDISGRRIELKILKSDIDHTPTFVDWQLLAKRYDVPDEGTGIHLLE
jgi:hypothetical protein